MKKIILFRKIYIIWIIMFIFGLLQSNVTFAVWTPTLSSVHISSNNSFSWGLLKYWDKVMLNITWSDSLTWVTANFNWVAASSVVWTWNTWTITSQNIVSWVWLVNFWVNFSSTSWDVWATVTWTTDGSSVLIDAVSPTASVNYSTTSPTAWPVLATLTWANEHIVVTNNWWLTTHNFTSNWSFTFEYRDDAWNTWSTTATVSNINTSLPIVTLNWSSIINLVLWSTYVESWAKWADQTDWTWVVSTVSWTVNTNVLWTYVLEYIKVNSLWFTWSTTRTINVVQALPSWLSFNNLTWVKLNTAYSSNTATITWIVNWTQISVVWWAYAIWAWAFTTLPWTINNWNTVKLRVVSANTYSATTTVTVTIWWASANFSVTTKSSSWLEKYVSNNPAINTIAWKLDNLISKYNKSDDSNVIQLRNDFLIELEHYVDVFNSWDRSSLQSIKKNILDIFRDLISELRKPRQSDNFIDELSNKIDAQSNGWRFNNGNDNSNHDEDEEDEEDEDDDDNWNYNKELKWKNWSSKSDDNGRNREKR